MPQYICFRRRINVTTPYPVSFFCQSVICLFYTVKCLWPYHIVLNLNVPDSRENILEMMTTDCMCDYVYNIISLVSFIFLYHILFLKVILKLLLKLDRNSGKRDGCFLCSACKKSYQLTLNG